MPVIGTLVADVNSYLETANAVLRTTQPRLRSARHSLPRRGRVDSAWSVSKSELNSLLNRRLPDLFGKLYRSLLLNGLVAGLSLLFAVLAYRQIVGPLRRTRGLAGKVRETKDYGLRI